MNMNYSFFLDPKLGPSFSTHLFPTDLCNENEKVPEPEHPSLLGSFKSVDEMELHILRGFNKGCINCTN